MVTVEKAIIARLEKSGKRFEVLVDPDIAYDLRSGKQVSASKMLAVGQIFSDAKKGDRLSTTDIEKAFGTTDVNKIAELIVKTGDVQLTTEFKRKKIEEKRKQIATLISRAAVDPRTKLPHPPERVLNAMEQAHVNIDPFLAADQQTEAVIKAIKQILPMSIEEVEIVVEAPAKYGSAIQKAAREYGAGKEQWMGATFVLQIKIPAGLKAKFLTHMSGITEGNAKIVEKK
ncbi:MAG: ribosome assembly factor SBDS [Candidatus Aenigmatarchaeota archaeon]